MTLFCVSFAIPMPPSLAHQKNTSPKQICRIVALGVTYNSTLDIGGGIPSMRLRSIKREALGIRLAIIKYQLSDVTETRD